jgi:GNAT superfamily N-acetyltransferase
MSRSCVSTADVIAVPVAVRPWLSSDRAQLPGLLEACGAQSLLHRFHGTTHRGVDTLLALTEVPSPDAANFVAWGDGRMVGLGTWVREDCRRAEVALLVCDAWQRRGVGRALLSALKRSALGAGLCSFDAWVLGGNSAGFAFLQSVAPSMHRMHVGDGVIGLSFELID